MCRRRRRNQGLFYLQNLDDFLAESSDCGEFVDFEPRELRNGVCASLLDLGEPCEECVDGLCEPFGFWVDKR